MSNKSIVFVLLSTLIATTASASVSVKEFKKFSVSDQSLYIGAAVSMLAYTYATQGNTAKARCIQDWYYGEPGKETPGPHQITIELAIAEERGADKFAVEGIIIGLTDRVCSQSAAKPK